MVQSSNHVDSNNNEGPPCPQCNSVGINKCVAYIFVLDILLNRFLLSDFDLDIFRHCFPLYALVLDLRVHSVRTVDRRVHSVFSVDLRVHSVLTVGIRVHSVLTVDLHRSLPFYP